jgi:large subunit ribosomal protein L6
MSRIGNKPVPVPSGVNITQSGRTLSVQGKLGTLTYDLRPEVDVKVEDGQAVITRKDDSRVCRAYHGLTRALVNNMVQGVTAGFKKELDIVGVGWNAQLRGQTVRLKLGYADEKVVPVPNGVKVDIQGTRITITGVDKQAVGECAARIRAQRKPEPYNGTGVKYIDEIITRKQGKAFAGGG